MSQLDSRREAIRLPAKELFQLASVSQSTWDRVRRGFDGTRIGHLKNISMAIIAEEQRLLEHLISLHPERARALLAEGGSRGEAGGTGGAARPGVRPAGSSGAEEAA
jgi:hypothetical protein